jgi:ABC-type lipoprotein release transport system permease subunit
MAPPSPEALVTVRPGIPAGGVVLLAGAVPVVALLASAVPVRRAARLRPAPALRAE